jgi:FAD synthase
VDENGGVTATVFIRFPQTLFTSTSLKSFVRRWLWKHAAVSNLRGGLDFSAAAEKKYCPADLRECIHVALKKTPAEHSSWML